MHSSLSQGSCICNYTHMQFYTIMHVCVHDCVKLHMTQTHLGKHGSVKLYCLQYLSIEMTGIVSQLLMHVRP